MLLIINKYVHGSICDMTCAGCLRNVKYKKSNSQRIPTPHDSQPLTPYICDLAFIRWQVTWLISSSLYPNRICTKCRITLTRNPMDNQAPINLNKPTREHSLATSWIPGDCSLCDNMYTKGPGRPKKRERD